MSYFFIETLFAAGMGIWSVFAMCWAVVGAMSGYPAWQVAGLAAVSVVAGLVFVKMLNA